MDLYAGLFFLQQLANTPQVQVMETKNNWYTYGSNYTTNNITYDLASISPKKSLECELTIEFLKIIYIIDEAPYKSWQKQSIPVKRSINRSNEYQKYS